MVHAHSEISGRKRKFGAVPDSAPDPAPAPTPGRG